MSRGHLMATQNKICNPSECIQALLSLDASNSWKFVFLQNPILELLTNTHLTLNKPFPTQLSCLSLTLSPLSCLVTALMPSNEEEIIENLTNQFFLFLHNLIFIYFFSCKPQQISFQHSQISSSCRIIWQRILTLPHEFMRHTQQNTTSLDTLNLLPDHSI